MNNKNTNKLNRLNYILYFAIVLFLFVVGFYFYEFKILKVDSNTFGTFGDFIGGTLNPIFALFSLFAIIYTIKIQTEELELSRKELEETRQELKESRIAQQEQSESLKLQNKATELQIFENTFFKLIELWVNTRINIKYGKHLGLEAIHVINRNTLNSLDKRFDSYVKPYVEQTLKIIEFIEESNVDKKRLYLAILSSQFTGEELEYLKKYFEQTENEELIDKYLFER